MCQIPSQGGIASSAHGVRMYCIHQPPDSSSQLAPARMEKVTKFGKILQTF